MPGFLDAAVAKDDKKKKKDPELFKKEKVDYVALLDKQIPPNEALAKVGLRLTGPLGGWPRRALHNACLRCSD